MRISIALCTYNGSRYLEGQLQSIANQTRLPDELVICDDGSQDSTAEIVMTFARSVPFTVYVQHNQTNLGSTRNFEQAIRLAQGDVIALCDQDDYWYPDKLATLEQVLSADLDLGYVFSDADIVDSDHQPEGYTLWRSVRFDYDQQQRMMKGQALSVLLRHPVVTGATLAFRSQFRDLILPIPSTWIHDEWIALLIAMTAKVGIIRQPLMQYRLHASNQIGAERVGLLNRVRIALKTNPDIYRQRYDQYSLLLDHVAARLSDHASVILALTEKREHFRVRATLPNPRWKRLRSIFEEMRRGRYQQYSGSSLNPLRDLLLEHEEGISGRHARESR